MLTNEQIAEILDNAADYIDGHGWPLRCFRNRRDRAEILALLRATSHELRAAGDDLDADEPGEDHLGWACPVCGEAVQKVPPMQATPDAPSQSYSHFDGEPLCPVVGEHGYVPAAPVRTGADMGGER